ncbi:MAG: hypothetical protein JXO22_11835 [Phycisphaerae bacterium]|nr:hypothetical protein [Phycisphaerae bacterium]
MKGALALMLGLMLALPALAQHTISDEDLQRLEDLRQRGVQRRAERNAPGVRAGQDGGNDRNWMNQLRQRVSGVMDSAKELGPWEEQYGYIVDAVENVYEQNGWTSEEHTFTLDMMREVSAIPPWQMQERFDTMIGVMSDRYDLDEEQQQKLKGLVIRESNEMFRKHGATIMQYTSEAIQTRALGDPFTPDQVARWSKMAMPVIQDSTQRLERSATEFMQDLRPEQQEIMQRDLNAGRERISRFQEMGQHWARGEWQPDDWGMANDPIQLAGEERLALEGPLNQPQAGDVPMVQPTRQPRRREAPTVADRQPMPPATATSGESPDRRSSRHTDNRAHQPVPNQPQPGQSEPAKAEGPWAKYVRDFIQKYNLNTDQESTAWRINTDMTNRAEQMTKRADQQIADLQSRLAKEPQRLAAATKKYEDQKKATMDTLFEQLKARLEKLPTTSQREAAGQTKRQPADKEKE